MMQPCLIDRLSLMQHCTKELKPILHRLYEARNELRALFPDLKFTLDGNLIGDIGEAITTRDFGLLKLPPGTPGHDFRTPDGRLVQVKTTQAITGGKVGLGLTMQSFEHLIVIQLMERGDYRILFDGPGTLIDAARTHRKTPSLTVKQLTALNQQVDPMDRILST